MHTRCQLSHVNTCHHSELDRIFISAVGKHHVRSSRDTVGHFTAGFLVHSNALRAGHVLLFRSENQELEQIFSQKRYIDKIWKI